MATITSADIIKFNNVTDLDILGITNDALKATPELDVFGATAVQRTSYKSLVQTALPSAGFRAPGGFFPLSDGSVKNLTTDCYFLDCSISVDKALAEGADMGWAGFMAFLTESHIAGGLAKISNQIWNGVYSADDTTSGFNGLGAILEGLTTGGVRDYVVTPNSGTAISDGSDVYLVRSTGPRDIQLAWGNGGTWEAGPIELQMQYSTSGSNTSGRFNYVQSISSYVGLQVTSERACVKIEGLSATGSNKGLDDALIAQAVSLFPAALPPTAVFMSRRSLFQLAKSRTYTSPTGAWVEFPTTVMGLPIFVTDGIGDNHSYYQPAPSSSSSSDA